MFIWINIFFTKLDITMLLSYKSSCNSGYKFFIRYMFCIRSIFPIYVLHFHFPLVHCSVAKSCPTLWDPMDCSMPGFHVLHHLPEFAQTHVHWVSDVIQPSKSLSPPSPPILNLSLNQGLFQWVSSLQYLLKSLTFNFAKSQSITFFFFRIYFLCFFSNPRSLTFSPIRFIFKFYCFHTNN